MGLKRIEGNQFRAFTLVELLVVIAILAILAAILFPVFSQAKLAAQSAVCISNLRQLTTAVTIYVNNYDDAYPPFRIVSASEGVATDQRWLTGYQELQASPFTVLDGGWKLSLLYPYVSSPEVTHCPTAPIGLNDWMGGILSYGANDGLMAAPSYSPLSISHTNVVELPAETILIADSGLYYPNVAGGYDFVGVGYMPWPWVATGPMDADGRHNGRANVSWADTHVKSFPVTVPPPAYYAAYGGMTLADAERFHIGYFADPKYPWGTGKDPLPGTGYYYVASKPTL